MLANAALFIYCCVLSINEMKIGKSLLLKLTGYICRIDVCSEKSAWWQQNKSTLNLNNTRTVCKVVYTIIIVFALVLYCN